MKSALNRLLVAMAIAGTLVTLATAQITVPNTFTPGTTISSSQMNANFSTLANALNRTGGTMTGTLTSQQITPSTTGTYDLGTSLVKFRDLFLSRNATVGGNVTVTGTLTTGSGSVALTDSTGKIPALTSSYFTSVDGSNLTGLSASNLSAGTIPDARFPATLPAMSGVNITNLNGSNIASGTVGTAYLGSGSASNAKFLRGDGTWGSVINIPEYNAGNSGTALTLDFSANGPIQKVTRNGNTTLTLTAPTYPGTVMVRFVHDATASTYTVAFSPSVKWPNGSAPTWTNTANAIDILSLYWDGSSWYGVHTANYS